ncbi:copper amine oxidase N-terminal domain-containing protein [Desulfotomaculum copahuensis]|uniref:copper amine oxidase N-terminal domain-containing protein n=1 Tax=Desulfotomaculum copahuensis TaxID=1838280 RepID=UPI001372D074|nr:copper amine oxidase N-terminal domain-containing protein [Desulfotomaculum copahuensis]
MSLYESKDGGKSWSQPDTPGSLSTQKGNGIIYGFGSSGNKITAKMYVSPDPNIVAISTVEGLYAANVSARVTSNDVTGGRMLITNVTPAVPAGLISTPDFPPGFAFGDDGTMYVARGAAIYYGNPVITNYDPGVWKQLYYAGSYVYSIKLAPDFAFNKTMIIQSGKGVMISADGGNSFNSTGLPVTSNQYAIAFSPDYDNDGTIAAAIPDYGVFLSIDRGRSWQNVFSHKGVTSVVIGKGGTLYAGTGSSGGMEKGIFISRDKGYKWQNIGLKNSNIVSLHVFPGRGNDQVYAVTDQGFYGTVVENGQTQQSGGPGNANTPAAPEQTISFAVGQNAYYVNSQGYSMDAVPFTENGRIYVPVRYLAKSLGLTDNHIKWDEKTAAVTLEDGLTLKFVNNGAFCYINGQKKNIDAPMLERNGRVYLPAKYVAEPYGYKVSWDGASQTVYLEK